MPHRIDMTDTVQDVPGMVSLGTLAGATPFAATPRRGLVAATASGTSTPASLKGRNGFDPAFIAGLTVPAPAVSAADAKDVAPLLDGSGTELKYRNFSVTMSRSRRLALWTACNLDGVQSRKLPRPKGEPWRLDGRMDARFQAGAALYDANVLDKGHLVRREDPVWGDGASEANRDTYHFTNCAPQHQRFNQILWVGLENYILANARAEGLRAAVLTGPVFRADDKPYRGIPIPREFWKIVAIVSDGRASATAYLASQGDLIDTMGFAFGQYKTLQVSIASVEKATGLGFGPLAALDGFTAAERKSGKAHRTLLSDWRQIQV